MNKFIILLFISVCIISINLDNTDKLSVYKKLTIDYSNSYESEHNKMQSKIDSIDKLLQKISKLEKLNSTYIDSLSYYKKYKRLYNHTQIKKDTIIQK